MDCNNNLDDLQEILEGCKHNDRHSQEKLYRQFYPGLFALCKKFFKDNDQILTALNNGMLNVYKNIGQYDSSKGELFTWIYTIVRNSALTYLRKKNNEVIYKELSEDVDFSEQYSTDKEIDWDEINFYLDKLPPSTRAVCVKYYVDGFSIKEIAANMNLSEGTVKWHLSDGRTRLRKLITNNV